VEKTTMSNLPKEAKARKNIPLARGLLDYFPDALCEVAELSRIGNEQHNPGEPLHWAKEKSTDEADSLMRHMIDRGSLDDDGVRHSTKVAWRALAQLQREIEAARVDEHPKFVFDPTESGDGAGFTTNCDPGDENDAKADREGLQEYTKRQLDARDEKDRIAAETFKRALGKYTPED
jgi:hypothetical protein